MKKPTIADRVIAEEQALGHKLLGTTTGWNTTRKGSNVAKKLEQLGVTPEQVIIRTGARAGANQNDGWQILIFSK